MELLYIIIALCFSAFFSGSEIAFVVANRLKAEVRSRRGGWVGQVVAEFIREPSRFLTTTLVGNNVALVIYSTLMAFALAGPLNAMYGGLSEGVSAVLILSTQTLIASLVVLIFGEILPKSLMREPADKAVFVVAPMLKLAYWLFFPFIKLADWSSSFLIKLFGADAETFQQFMRRDFEIVIRESKESGQLDLDTGETELLANVFTLGSLRVKDCLVPRTGIEAVPEEATLEEVRERFIETGFSKLPIYRDNIDTIVGVVFAHDLFLHPASLAEITRSVMAVPESKAAKDLLREFLASNTSIAVAIDEYGGTAGLITVEDLLEELFGDIQDEFDTEDALMRQVDDTTYVVSGRAEVEDVTARFALTFPEGDFETIAGMLLEHIGHIPESGAEFALPGYRVIVLKATSNRIDLVKFVALPPESAEPPVTA